MSVETQLPPSFQSHHGHSPVYRKAARSLELRVGKGATMGGMTLGGVPVSPRSPGSPKLSSLAAAAAAAAAAATSSPADIVSASRTQTPNYTHSKTRTSPPKLSKQTPLSPNSLSPALTPSTARRITHAFVAKISVEKVRKLFSTTRTSVPKDVDVSESTDVQVRRISVPLWKLLLIDKVLDKLEASQPGISMTVFRSNNERRRHWTAFKGSDDSSSANESRNGGSKDKVKSAPPQKMSTPTLQRRGSSPLRFEVEVPETDEPKLYASIPDVKRIAAEARRPSLKIEDILAVEDPRKIESTAEVEEKPTTQAPMTICGVLGFDKNPAPKESKSGFWSIFCCFA